MICKKIISGAFIVLALCMTLMMCGCRKEDGEIGNDKNNGNSTSPATSTRTPMESVESMVPDAIEKFIP